MKLALFLLAAGIACGQPVVRFIEGTAAAPSTACDAATERGGIYVQTGDPATVATRISVCVQTGASTYAWHPVSHKIGITAPTTCVAGELFFDTDATAGLNWYGCTAADTWTLLGDGGGGGGAPTDATYITQTANGTLSAEQALGALATGCLGSTTTTGVVASRTITGDSEITVTGGDCSANPVLAIGAAIARDAEINVQGTTNEITSSGSGVAPTLSLSAQLDLSGKEVLGATPLRFEGATDNNIYSQISVTDPTVGTKTLTIPNADTVAPQAYTCTAQFPRSLSGTTGATACESIADGDIPSGITRDSEVNVQGTANEITSSGSGVAPTLSIADTFRITGKAVTAPVKTGTVPPTACTVGDFFFDTDATVGQQIYACTTTGDPGTWTLQGDGGGGGGITSIGGQTGSTQTVTRGAGIGGTSATDDHAFTTASGETDFLASGALTCGAGTRGRMQVHTTPLQYCDNAATPALQYAAYGDSAGASTTGDSATSFFSSGILEGTIGGTGNGFFAVSGPATSLKTFTFPNASATVLTTNALVTGAQGGTNNGFTEFTGPTTSTKTFTLPNASTTILTTNAAVTVGQGGTGIASGTSGGVPYFSGTTTIASSGALAASTFVLGGGAGAAPTTGAGYTASTAGSAGTNATNMGTSTALSRQDHEHLVPWQAGMFFEATPATGEFAMPLPVNNQCGGSINVTSASLTALTKGSGTLTFNVVRYNNAAVSQGNLYAATQTYDNTGNNRQDFTTNQNQTGIGATDYFRFNVVTVNAQDDFAFVMQGTCKNK